MIVVQIPGHFAFNIKYNYVDNNLNISIPGYKNIYNSETKDEIHARFRDFRMSDDMIREVDQLFESRPNSSYILNEHGLHVL